MDELINIYIDWKWPRFPISRQIFCSRLLNQAILCCGLCISFEFAMEFPIVISNFIYVVCCYYVCADVIEVIERGYWYIYSIWTNYMIHLTKKSNLHGNFDLIELNKWTGANIDLILYTYYLISEFQCSIFLLSQLMFSSNSNLRATIFAFRIAIIYWSLSIYG